MVRPSSVDPDMVNKCVKYLKKYPDLKVPAAMKQTNFSAEEVANLSLRRLIRRSLPGKTMTSLKAHALLSLPPQPDRAERHLNRAIGDEGAVVEPGSRSCAIAHTLSPLLPQPPPLAMPQGATEVILAFSVPSPTRQSTIRETVVPSQRDCARLLGIPQSTLQRVDGVMIGILFVACLTLWRRGCH